MVETGGWFTVLAVIVEISGWVGTVGISGWVGGVAGVGVAATGT